MPSSVELMARQNELAHRFHKLVTPREVDALRPLAETLAGRLIELAEDSVLWDEIEQSGSAPIPTKTELDLLNWLDWDTILDAVGYEPPPSGAQMGGELAEAANAAFEAGYPPHHDLLNLVRTRMETLADALNRDARDGGPNDDPNFIDRFNARIGVARRVVRGLDWTKVLLEAAKEGVGKSRESAVAAGFVGAAALNPAAAVPVLLLGAGIGMAKGVIDGFHGSLQEVREVDAGQALAIRSRWVDECLSSLDQLAQAGRIGLMFADLDNLATTLHQAGTHDSPGLVDPTLADGVRHWAATLGATVTVLWDLSGALWGEVGARVTTNIAEPAFALALDVARTREAIALGDLKAAMGYLQSARDQLECIQESVISLNRTLLQARLILHV